MEIWDDSGSGLPGSPVGTIGSVNVSSLMTTGEFDTFDGTVSGLALNTSCFVVLDAIDVSTADSDNTFRIGVVTPAAGTNCAGS